MSLQKYSLNFGESFAKVGLRFRASSFDPRPYFVFRKDSGAVGAFATHIGDIPWCGDSDALAQIRTLSEYFLGVRKARESSLAHGDMKSPKGSKFSVKLSLEEFTKNLGLLPASPELWADR